MISKGDWRRFRGLLTALLVFAFTAAPNLDALVCCEDAPPTAHTQVVDLPEGEQNLDDHCQHGHCHHGAAMAFLTGDGVAEPYSMGQDRPTGSASGDPLDLTSGLMRPPRA